MHRLAALLLGCALGAGDDSKLPAKVEAWLAPFVAAHDFSGVVLVARGDELLVESATGAMSLVATATTGLESGAPIAANTRFRIASITKAFTAAAVVILVERGELALDDPLAEFIEDFPGGDQITIRHLLLHLSGVGNPDSSAASDATLDTLVQELARKPLAFVPGSGSRYSNGGYALLARVIERVSGQSWDAFLREEIFEPLELTDTAPDRKTPALPSLARGHVPGPGAKGLVDAPGQGAWAAIGGGALVSSAKDLWRFGRAVRNKSLFDRTALEHPYGWGVRERFGRGTIEQSGIMNGTASYLAIYPDDDLYVVALSNVQTGLLEQIGIGLAALALDLEPPKIAPSPPAIAADADQRAKWIGRFVNRDVAPIEILEEAGELRLRWGNSRETCYLTPTGPATLQDRQDSIAMELVTVEGVPAVKMRWPDGAEHVFSRVR